MKDIKFEDEKLVEKKDEKRFPVRMKHGYFPVDPTWAKNPATGEPMKVLVGEVANLPIEEARKLVKAGVAERADEIEI